eukprot:CAMPEP_0119070380 /NCGR_PEP_ID=MMETSP1178-20130426/37968_1 /TAXON_ID=33656 /ORGANISM="unid sp, Strain CCMP2000" /LENGTH=213 /DNA_ID=CAMNT_0007052211 /DNA_START=16 /DNA_END=657 /DNA_ORIENTATION=-
MIDNERGESTRLMRVCSRRAIDKLQADLDAATSNPEVANQIIQQASEEDLSILRRLHTRSVGLTLSVVGVSFFGFLPRRSRPLASAAVAVSFGSAAGVIYGALATAEAVEKMVGQAVPSVLADRVICPAIREFGPCLEDERCAAAMAASSGRLFRCCALCQERAARAPPRAPPAQGFGGDGGDRGGDCGDNSDPFFSGGYERDPANQRWAGGR